MAECSGLTRLPCMFEAIVSIVVNGVRSAASRPAYHYALMEFLAWHAAGGREGFSKAVVQEYRSELERRGLAPSSINLHLSVVRKLAAEAADNGVLAPDLAAGISRVRGARGTGVRTGRWLTAEQAEALICLPDLATKKGKRDRMILSLLIGCGLRRQELAWLRFEHIQQRDGRWVIADLVGKGQRVRTVPMPEWAKEAVDEWSAAAGLSSGLVIPVREQS